MTPTTTVSRAPFVLMMLLVFAAGAVPAAGQKGNTNLIDLVQVGLNSPSKITPGKKFRILDRVENQGESGSLPTVTHFYLSTDDRLDEKDVLIGGRRVPSLPANESHEEITSVTVATTVASGEYYLLVVCDATKQMDERYENNNIRAIKVRVLAPAS